MSQKLIVISCLYLQLPPLLQHRRRLRGLLQRLLLTRQQ